MNSDKTRNISRVVYVDPTDIPNSNGNYSGAINFPYEDYCMSVDLSVIITNRYSCGWAKTNGEYKEFNFSSRNGSLSFLGGSKISNSSDSFLTTNFTDISMTSPSDNTSECLGIESISISYGQWMFPQVVIKFIDVRGATVMQPSEYNYYNTQEKGISSDLYKSLFTYPYPMFNLTIKGFYGKSVTYKLAVQKTDLEFDNENGNFIIIATFIGYMYGIYAELPMTYIAAAPYMEAGKKYWDEKISDGTFWFKNSSGLNFSPMKTIPQLSNIIAAASKNEKVISAASEHKEVINRSDDKLNKLTEIEDAYPFNDWIFEDGFFISLTTSYINDILIIRQKIEKFLTTLKEYDKKYHDNNYFYDEFSELEKYCPQINSVQYYVDTIHIRNIDMFTEFQYNNGVFQQKTEEQPLKLIENERVKNFIYSKLEGTNNISFKLIYIKGEHKYFNFLENIKNKKSEISKEKLKKEEEFKTLESSIMEEVLGFKPSIRNIFDLVFAHMETFFHCFYSSTNNIRTDLDTKNQNRQKMFFGLNDDETDTLNSEKFLPPYFGVYKNKKNNEDNINIFSWPGELENGYSLEEVKFVTSLLNGAKMYNIDSSSGGTDGSVLNTNGITTNPNIDTFLPLTPYDFVFKNIGINQNPYYDVKMDILRGGDDVINKILSIFALRAYYYSKVYDHYMEGPFQLNDSKAFGILEAINLYKAIGKNVSKAFLNFIIKYTSNNGSIDEFFRIITSKDSNPISNNEGFFNISSDNHRLIFNKKVFPVGNIPLVTIKDDFINIEEAYETLSEHKEYLSFVNESESTNTFFISDEENYLDNIIDNLEKEIANNNIIRGNGIQNRFSDNFKTITDTNSAFKDLSYKYPSKVYELQIVNNIAKHIEKSIFDYKFYYNLTDIQRAFIFLQARPIGNTVKENYNGEEYKINLLLEGSQYWWQENYEKSNWEWDDTYYFPTQEQSFFDENGNFIIYKINQKNGYKKWIEPKNTTPSRRKILKNLFIEWANSFDKNSFKGCERHLLNKDLYIDKEYAKGLNIEKYITNKENESDNAIDLRNLQEFLKSLFSDIYTIFDLYNGWSNYNSGVSRSRIEQAMIGFINQLKEFYGDTVKINNENPTLFEKQRAREEAENPFLNTDIRLSTYITLKSLYDKWLCSPEKGPLDTWSLSSSKSDFNNFIYVDSFYHDIGYRLNVNITKVSAWLDSCIPSSKLETNETALSYTGKSVYDFLTSVSQDAGGMLLALPHKIGVYEHNKINEIFTPHPLYSITDDGDSSTYVFMYTYKPSEHLGDSETGKYDMNGWTKDGDGVDFNDKKVRDKLFKDNGYSVPVFAVTYAKQNQGFFKNIRLSTESNGVTEASLAATFNIASKDDKGKRETTLYGQDLYRVFTQYAYKCSAECMGNMQITPLMYFQLNNIPLWRGGYQILKVNHEIVAGNITTKFEGVRINRHAIPLTDDIVITNRDTGDYNDDSNATHLIKHKIINNTSIISAPYNSYDGVIVNVGNIKDTVGNLKINPLRDIDFTENNISNSKPIICLTPAHGPYTDKKEEWEWSSKVVDRIYEILKDNHEEFVFYDGTYLFNNVQKCNKAGAGTRTGYNLKEVDALIKKYGSNRVISIVPHWNGGGGNYHWTMVNKASTGVREDSYRLAECMRGEFLKVKEMHANDERYCAMFKGDCRIENEPENVEDKAPTLNCACVLTENWFADCKDVKNPKEWFKTNGIEEIAQAHAKAIKKYIDLLVPNQIDYTIS